MTMRDITGDVRIWIACDHGGFDAKTIIIDAFGEKGYSFNDVGCYSKDICRYPHYASRVCEAVASGVARRGVLICSTGIGMSIFANKYKGVRAALCTDSYMAKMTRKHNDSNILCLGGKITGPALINDIVETWLNGVFEGGRHAISLKILQKAENAMISGSFWKPDDQNV
jgi:ribose 5-phosphate isomerase B